MINEQNSNQTNPQTSTNISYGYPTNLMNLSSMHNSNDLYSYYPNNLYQPHGTFDEYNQWAPPPRDNSTILSSSNASLPYSPQYYPSSNGPDLFDYSAYSSTNDYSWNIPNYNYQSSIPVIGNQKKSTIGDRCDNLLAQQMNSIYLNNSNDLSIARPSGPKSYASVVSSETNKKSNVPMRIMSNEFNSSQHPITPTTITPTTNTTTTTPKKIDHQYNPKDFNFNPKGARFFVIKSYSEDDVHRSIKYNIWCSTEHGNKRLDRAFREREGKGPIYLFFSVNASGHFCGIAEMITPVDYEHQTDIWHMSNKWQGKFEVKWIYVKDVPNQQFRNIRLENNENKPVTNSRDTQEIPYEEGKLMLKIFHMYRHKTSIFDDFQYYESKQAEEFSTKKST